MALFNTTYWPWGGHENRRFTQTISENVNILLELSGSDSICPEELKVHLY